MQKVFYGKEQQQWTVTDFGFREMGIMVSLSIAIIWLGLFPAAVLNLAKSTVVSVVGGINKKADAKQEAKNRKYPAGTDQSVFGMTVTPQSMPDNQMNPKTQIKDDRTGY